MKLNLRSCWAALFALTLTGAVFSACEKAVFDEENSKTDNKNANLILRVKGSQIDDSFTTRAMVDITTYCTRFNFVLYKDGNKIKSYTQTSGDANYGEVALTLDAGTYKLLVLAHSSQGGNPTLSDPESIQFTNAIGFSDTFYYYADIVVTKEPKIHEITLTRAVARLSFVINDDLPSNVAYLRFYYTGGSGVLNALTGYAGNVNSRQERLIGASGLSSPLTIPLYTFLSNDEGTLQLTVTALESDKETVVKERTFTDVPVERQKETILEGDFFDHPSENGFSFKAETDWQISQTITY